MDPLRLDGKVVILTGGSGFLGSQYRSSLLEAGAQVENFDLDTGVDVTDESSVKEAVQRVIRQYGRIDGLITNAAMNPKADEKNGSASAWAPYDQFDVSLFRKELDLNVVGSFVVAKAVSPYFREARSGSIVFVASDLACIAPTNSLYEEGKFKDIAYGTSKAAILGLMRFFAAYLGPYQARANALVPGGMQRGHDEEFVRRVSQLNMLGRMSQPGEYDGAVRFLLSDASSYMTGSCLVIDGGRTAM
jgi:NAD(P)-dependent dehydrogenase (short-subunit alcohol dehydrogenase family)